MKKYLIVIIVPVFFLSCSKNFSGNSYRVIPVNFVMKMAIDVTHKHVVHNYISSDEVQIITYDENNQVIATQKEKYRIDGSFLYLDDQRLEIRYSKDTVDLYNEGDLFIRLVPQ